MKKNQNNKHQGAVLETDNGFDVIDCKICGFKHILPIPTEDELEKAYQHEYYTDEKPLFLERHKEDLEWWNVIYSERYELFEKYLPDNRRKILDIGSGPGFFLLNGQERGWKVKGIEPSEKAAEHSQKLGVDVDNDFYSKDTTDALGKFDAINMSEVLEHIPYPEDLLTLAHKQLDNNGIICIAVPNDFNPIQTILREHHDFKPWWVAPPHHINYFDFDSLSILLKRCGFDVIHKEATFPIDMFLLMGDNYIGNDELGRSCHSKRKTLELNLSNAGMTGLKRKLYQKLAELNLGREVVIFARKMS